MCRRGLKVNAGKTKVMVMNGEEGLEGEFKYLGCVLNKASTDWAECSRKVVSERRVAGAIMSIVNVRGLQLECASV